MTTIRLHTSDQRLIASQKVRIAAGDINSVILHVEFDDAWKDFITRKALFANDAVSGTQDILLIGNECIVPHEVLAKDGMLSISITGYTADGTARKTSSIAKLKVLESLSDAVTTIEPTMDLYMQYLAALNEKMNPVTANVNNQLSENLAAVNEAIAEQKAWMQGDVIWNNPDTTQNMGALTIPCDRAQYPRLHIEVLREANGNSWFECVCVHSNGIYAAMSGAGTSYRQIKVTDTAIEIEAGDNPRESIPYRIIGYKY